MDLDAGIHATQQMGYVSKVQCMAGILSEANAWCRVIKIKSC